MHLGAPTCLGKGERSRSNFGHFWLPPSSLSHVPLPLQARCQSPLPGQGAARVGSLGPSPAGSGSRPLSRLYFALKMQSIPAILITGRCISQQPVHTKEQQTKNDFSTCLQPLPFFSPETSPQSLPPRPRKALQVCTISFRVCWCDIKVFFL